MTALRWPPARIQIVTRRPSMSGWASGPSSAWRSSRALLQLAGRPEPIAPNLAGSSGRGRRSGIGLHGFLHGGLIVDGGRRDRGPSAAAGRPRCRSPRSGRSCVVQPPGPRAATAPRRPRPSPSSPRCPTGHRTALPAGPARHPARRRGARPSSLRRRPSTSCSTTSAGLRPRSRGTLREPRIGVARSPTSRAWGWWEPARAPGARRSTPSGRFQNAIRIAISESDRGGVRDRSVPYRLDPSGQPRRGHSSVRWVRAR